MSGGKISKDYSIGTSVQEWQLHRKYFAIIVLQDKCDAIMIWTNGFEFFCDNKIFLMRYYCSSFAIIFCDFRFFFR